MGLEFDEIMGSREYAVGPIIPTAKRRAIEARAILLLVMEMSRRVQADATSSLLARERIVNTLAREGESARLGLSNAILVVPVDRIKCSFVDPVPVEIPYDDPIPITLDLENAIGGI